MIPTTTEAAAYDERRRFWFARHLYAQVLVAIVLGATVGHFWPDIGESLKPLGDGFIKLVKMIIAPVIFLTLVTGIAGMKDRHAVTRQWLSLPPPVTPEAAQALALDGIAILEAVRHNHKLRTGHVRQNRFALRVRGAVPGAAERARAILTRLAEAPGAPNWYGEQRFGRDGDNAAKGRELLATGRRSRDKKLDRLFVSACYANQGPTQKRVRPAPMGRAFRVLKRTAHLTVQVGERPEKIVAVSGAQPKRKRQTGGRAKAAGRAKE